jgi:hypothetical protein
LYKSIFAIFLLCTIHSKGELDNSIADEINANASSQFIFDAITDIELDSEFGWDSSILNVDETKRFIQLTYLAKYSRKPHFPLLNNKFQYLQPRAPPFIIV